MRCQWLTLRCGRGWYHHSPAHYNPKGRAMASNGELEQDAVVDKDTAMCSRESVRNCCCTWNPKWKLAVLAVTITIYMIVGGGIFVGLEGPSERDRIAEAQTNQTRLNELRERIINNISANGMLNRTQAAALVYLIGNLSAAEATFDDSRNWEFGPAIFFASTVVTTIGYGSIAPETFGGRLFFIFYALAGIPIALVFLSALGDMLNKWLEKGVGLLGKRAEEPMVKVIVIVSSVIIGLCAFIFVPAIIFAVIEPWSYFESIYFCFVTLTTVGFGDFVPSQSAGSDGFRPLHGFYRIATACWTWLGLAFLSLMIARAQSTFTDMGDRAEKCIATRKQKREEARERELTEPVSMTSDEQEKEKGTAIATDDVEVEQ